MGTHTGYTFTELLVALAIVAVLAGFAAPSLSTMMMRNQATAEINRLVGAINLTRQSAVSFHTLTTVCALKDNGRCGGAWNQALTIFTDKNRDARLASPDEIIATVSPTGLGNSVRWRAFRNRPYLQMTPFGYTPYQNGNFVVCPPNGDLSAAKQLIVNIQGRVRHNHRRDSADFLIDSRGKRLRC